MDLVLISVILLVVVAIVALVKAGRSRHPLATIKMLVTGLMGADVLAVLVCLVGIGLLLVGPLPAMAQEGTAAPSGGASNAALGAALATGLACIGAGIAVGIAGAAAIGGITEKPEILGRTLIFVGLAEGIAIYGLIISFLILFA